MQIRQQVLSLEIYAANLIEDDSDFIRIAELMQRLKEHHMRDADSDSID